MIQRKSLQPLQGCNTNLCRLIPGWRAPHSTLGYFISRRWRDEVPYLNDLVRVRLSFHGGKILSQVKLVDEVTTLPAWVHSVEQQSFRRAERIENFSPGLAEFLRE